MSKEELIEVLRQFDEKRVEELPEKTRNIFYAIMKIADERDEYIHLYESTLKDLDISVKNKIELENIINEAKEECKSVIGNPEHTIVSKNELMKLMLNTLNKGDKNE